MARREEVVVIRGFLFQLLNVYVIVVVQFLFICVLLSSSNCVVVV